MTSEVIDSVPCAFQSGFQVVRQVSQPDDESWWREPGCVSENGASTGGRHTTRVERGRHGPAQRVWFENADGPGGSPGPSVNGLSGYDERSDVVVELEHPKRCWQASINSGKHGLTCANADFDRRSMMADFGLERISCGIPAESGRGGRCLVRVPEVPAEPQRRRRDDGTRTRRW